MNRDDSTPDLDTTPPPHRLPPLTKDSLQRFHDRMVKTLDGLRDRVLAEMKPSSTATTTLDGRRVVLNYGDVVDWVNSLSYLLATLGRHLDLATKVTLRAFRAALEAYYELLLSFSQERCAPGVLNGATRS